MGATAGNQSTKESVDVCALKSEVESFVSSLGLSTATPASGFDDSDFRKSGRIISKARSKKAASKPVHDDNTYKAGGTKPRVVPSKPIQMSQPFLDSDPSVTVLRKNDKYKKLPKLPLVKASTLDVWHNDLKELEQKVFGDGFCGKLDLNMGMEEWKGLVDKKRELGDRVMWQYGQDYEMGRARSADIKMLMTTQKSGTAADRVSAFSVLVGDNPVANLRSLDALIGMITSKVGKRHALTAFEALKEMFILSLLPDRKLKTLLQRPLHKLPETNDGYSLLLFWYWEDCLKQRYERFVSALEEAASDSLPALKDKALKTIYMLLKSKPEQERKLLSALVNKLGDPQNKGASNADFLLSNLLSEHQNMKLVVIDEVDSFLFRPHLGLRAKYHAVNFLSQIRLSDRGDGPKIAKRLVDIYFAVFKVLIDNHNASQKVDEGFKSDGHTVIKAKKYRVTNSLEAHVELDSRILSALLTGVNRAFPYVSSSETDDVVEVQTPMLFRLAHSENFNVGIQALMLLEKISSKHHVVSDRFYRALYSKLLLPSVLNSSKGELFTGLLLRAIKNDVSLKRIAAFSKRILQVALQQPPQYACGCLFVISEVLKARPPLWNLVQQSETVDDDVEVFKDIEDEADHNSIGVLEKQSPSIPFLNESSEETKASSFDKTRGGKDQHGENDLYGGYNPRHREPLFCNADRTSWWELGVLASHVHPSVATMAGTLLSGAYIVYSGNPFNDLSLAAFLDKFMEKKPKQTDWHGGSEIEPATKLDTSNHLIGSEILSLAEVDVPPEDVVFHKFYMNKMTSSKSKRKKKKKLAVEDADELLAVGGDDDPDGGNDSDDEEIDNVLETADLSFEAEYDYDDLDRVATETDNDLVDDDDDADIHSADDFDGDDGDSEVDTNLVKAGYGDDGEVGARRGKRKSRTQSGVSPFASLEDFEDLINKAGEPSNRIQTDKVARRKKIRRKA